LPKVHEALRIVRIAERPDSLETVARWQFAEWGQLEPSDSLAARIADLRAQAATPGRIPHNDPRGTRRRQRAHTMLDGVTHARPCRGALP
jgi:hypothetical protein